jgi:hypothetical protein
MIAVTTIFRIGESWDVFVGLERDFLVCGGRVVRNVTFSAAAAAAGGMEGGGAAIFMCK